MPKEFHGTPHGGGELYPSILHRILRDKVYIGKTTHKKTSPATPQNSGI